MRRSRLPLSQCGVGNDEKEHGSLGYLEDRANLAGKVAVVIGGGAGLVEPASTISRMPV